VGEVVVLAVRRSPKRFCRRCLRWHPPNSAEVRGDLFDVDGRAVVLDYVLCDGCFGRADHKRWYLARAEARARLGYNEDAILRVFVG
jgi:hypothetical protein